MLKSRPALIAVATSDRVTVRRCAATGSWTAGIAVIAGTNVSIEKCAAAGNSTGVSVAGASSGVRVVATTLAANDHAQLSAAPTVKDLYANFNAFVVPQGAAVGRLGRRPARDLDAWRKLSGQDADSLAASAGDFADLRKADFRVRAGSMLAFSGFCSRPIGPDGVYVSGRIERKPVERVEVVSTTRTSANITYWTPGRVTGTAIEWGRTPKYGSLHDRADGGRSEFETFHSVSLLGLEPDTTYHYRVGFRDHDTPREKKVRRKDRLVWSGDHTFRTAKTDPVPRRLYVSLKGADVADGLTPATAWRTLRKAAREARAGDTVTIAPGRYMELLRPLQTGTGPDRRITFRAEKPLTVYLDGGMIKFRRDGRSHCVQIQSKAFITVENLTCEAVKAHDNGGYRGGIGYSGLIKLSGSAGIEIKKCVMDGRARYMPCLWAFDAGLMPGVPEDVPGFTATDSVFAFGWRSVGIAAKRRCVFRNNVFIRAMTGMFTIFGGTKPGAVYLRDNIVQSLLLRKQGNPLWNSPRSLDSDYNCFYWDPENKRKTICYEGRRRKSRLVRGLADWRKTFKQDLHSIEADPGYPLSKLAGFGNNGRFDRRTPIRIEDLILPADSPCRGKGENGGDIGPRFP